MTSDSLSPFTTDTADVIWSHLHTPDIKFGADAANHNITIVVDDQLQSKLDEMASGSGATKINGMRVDDEGRTLLKAKSKTFCRKGVDVFPCRDAMALRTEAVPFGGDKVRLRLSPALLSRDSSMSLYLNGVQIIEKNAPEYDGGFEEVTDGFDGANFIPPTEQVAEDDIPV
jgi:hypothetical protein